MMKFANHNHKYTAYDPKTEGSGAATLKSFVFAKDGTLTANFRGQTFVPSPWSDGYRQTKFSVTMDANGGVTWRTDDKSRTPDYLDVAAALAYVLAGVEADKRTPYASKSISANYVGLNGRFLGIDPNWKLSCRGNYNPYDAAVLKALLLAL